MLNEDAEYLQHDTNHEDAESNPTDSTNFIGYQISGSKEPRETIKITFPDEVEEFSDTEIKFMLDFEQSEVVSDTIVKTEDHGTENAESSDEELFENRVYLEYTESDTEELQSNNVTETLSVPENEESDSEEFKFLFESYKPHKFPHCYVCELTVRTSEQLNEHSSTHNSKEIVSCEVCENIIQKDLYKTHLKIHRELYNKKLEKSCQKMECTVCGKCVGKSYMKVHLLQHGTEEEKAKRYKKCTICNADISISYLTDHMKRVHMHHKKPKTDKRNNNKLKCPVCFRMFKESTYKKHVASHASTCKKYICEECGREFFSKSTLSTHVLTHKEVYKYKCQFCPYRGKHLGLIKIHVRTHTKDYSYKCDCGASFITKSNLNAHQKIHHSAYRIKFICSQCGKSYSKEKTLQNHVESIHEGIKAYACNVCGKKYGTKVVMAAHKKRVHNIVGPGRVAYTPPYNEHK